MNRSRARSALVGLVLVAAGIPVLGSPARAAGPQQVMPADPLPAFTEAKGSPAPQPTVVDVTGNPNFTQALQVAVTGSPTSPGLDGEYSISLGGKTAATVHTNDAAVASFWGRRISPTSGTGQASFVFERDGGSYKKSAVAALQLGTEWQRFTFPFRIAEDYGPGEAHFQLWLGYGPQTLQIAGVSVLDYGQDDLTGWPKVSYAGRESNAPWRAAANQRIDQYRKGNLNVNVVDAGGHPVSGAAVSVKMQHSAFNFGTAADPAHLFDDPSVSETPTDAANSRRIDSTLFNQGSLGNSLKWNHWEVLNERNALTYPALQWYRNNDIRIRGHNLIWPSWGVMPPDVQGLANDPAALRTRIDNHITDEASGTRGLVDEWDVINEPYSEHNVQDILGQGEMDSWFRLARAADPTAQLFLNDYGLVEDNGWQTRHQDYVYDTVRGMLSRGVPIQGVGLESHFGAHGGLELTPPEDLLPIVDRFAALGLKVGITEFDVATDDQQLQADYTRDFMTMMFSDPHVTEISNFGNWAGNIYNPLVALYNTDWSAKPNALVLEDLIHHQWWTNAAGTTGANGAYSVRGFQGDYVVTVTVNGVSKQARVSMPSTAGASVTVIADGIQTTVRDKVDTQLGDGGFESGLRGWFDQGGSQTTTDAHSGTQALRVTGSANVTQLAVPLTAGTNYLLSAWGKSSAAGNQCKVTVRGGAVAGQTTFEYSLSYTDETAYTQKVLGFTPPGGTAWTQVLIKQYGPAGLSCTVDDVTLTPTVGTPPPAGSGDTAVKPVLPTAACVVANAGGTFTAYFGYSNPNAFGVPVVLGRSNAVSPAPADRGQPDQFLPSQRPRRAAVAFNNGQSVSWQLDGQTQTASAATPRCT